MATDKTEGPGVYTRLPEDWHEAMERLRREAGRSMAAEVRVCVQERLERLGLIKKAAA